MSHAASVSLPWPAPALLAWLLAWTCDAAGRAAGMPGAAAFALAACCGSVSAVLLTPGRRRRCIGAVGYPLSALAASGGGGLPAWCWLVAALALLLAYPLGAWRDAPFFPTPAAALAGLDAVVAVGPGERILDAGCGAGDGLRALARLWPAAALHGIERSRPLAWLAALRARPARIARGDMWAASWTGCRVVYVFQRPESMSRAWAKAGRELAPGAFLVSLEFAVPGVEPLARVGTRPVWVYRVGPRSTAAACRR